MAQDKDKLFEKIYFMLGISKAVKEVKVVGVPNGPRHIGGYTIDNIVAERTIRNMTIQRKNSLFFCNDKSARNSDIYNTFIPTCPKSASDDNRSMKISEKSLKLTIQNFNDPVHRVVKRVYTLFWTDTNLN